LRCAPRVDPRDRDRHRAAPCGTTRATIGTPSVVSRPTGLPRPPKLRAPSWLKCAAQLRASFSPRCRRLVRQHVERSAPGPASRRRFALRLLVRHDARCVGPTSAFSRLRTSTRASLVPGVVLRFRACASGRSPVSRQCDSLRWAARSPWIHRGGLVVPVVMRANRTSGVPVASPASVIPLARSARPWEPPRPFSARPRERCGTSIRSGTPSI